MIITEAFSTFLDQVLTQDYVSWHGRTVAGRGSFVALQGIHFGLALSGAQPLSRYRGARNVLEEFAKDISRPKRTKNQRFRSKLDQMQAYLLFAYKQGVHLGYQLGLEMREALPEQDQQKLEDVLITQAAKAGLFHWLQPQEPEVVEEYLRKEFSVAFALGYFEQASGIPARAVLLERLQKKPGLYEAVTEMAWMAADEHLTKVSRLIEAADKPQLPIRFLKNALLAGREAAAHATRAVNEN